MGIHPAVIDSSLRVPRRQFPVYVNGAVGPCVISVVMVALLPLVPLIGKYHRRPAIPTPLLAQATQGRKIHMRPRDQNILARELKQQVMPRRRRRSRVDVEDRRDLGSPQ